MNEKQEEDTQDSPNVSNLGSYFNNSTPTIFDEIVSPTATTRDKFTPPPPMVSKNLFDSDLLDDNQSEHTTIHDNHRDAWIPSESTRKILCSISNQTERENLTMPGLALANDMLDSVKELTKHFLGEEETINRNIPTMSDVTQDERGLRSLIKDGCYRAAVNLSGRLLAVYGQGYGKINHQSKHTPHSLQLWFTRLALLTKMRQTDVLETESAPFGNLDKPDMYYIFYPELYGTRPGSMASFAFRLLLAEIPMHCGKAQKALDNLFAILATIKRIIRNLENGLSEEGHPAKFSLEERTESLKLWKARKSRTLFSITNCTLVMKNYALASEVLEQVGDFQDWTKEQTEIIKSAIARLYLSVGDIIASETILNSIQYDTTRSANIRQLIDKGILAVAQNAFTEALKHFRAAAELDPLNIMLTNNIAVCLLYTGKLEEAVKLMENLVLVTNPTKSMQEAVLLNMCTLYELHTTHGKQLKMQLLRQLNRFSGDATNIQCLKLTL